jgi:hypothetical protein
VLLPTLRRCIAPNRPRATYARANVLRSQKATLFPVGPTNRPGTGWITPQGQKTDPTAAGSVAANRPNVGAGGRTPCTRSCPRDRIAGPGRPNGRRRARAHAGRTRFSEGALLLVGEGGHALSMRAHRPPARRLPPTSNCLHYWPAFVRVVAQQHGGIVMMCAAASLNIPRGLPFSV